MSDSVSGRTTEMLHRIPCEKGTINSEISALGSFAKPLVRHKSRKTSTAENTSKDCCMYRCGPCNTVGDDVEAQGFCINCDDYLCDTCFKSHSRSKASKEHKLLDKKNMPKQNIVCDPCLTAGDEAEAEGYCIDCGEFLCSSCFRSHSRSKASREHVLLNKNEMLRSSVDVLTSSLADMQIPQKYIEKYTFVRDINIKANMDKKGCCITDIDLVTSNDVIVADSSNKSLKLIDLENDVIKGCLKLETESSGLAVLSRQELAVALNGKNKIQIISLCRGLSVVRTFKTNGQCVAVKCINEKLYVSFTNPVKFEILKLTGEVCYTIRPDDDVLKNCILPKCMAITSDQKMIYISDWKTNNVLSIDMNGRMLHLYKGKLDKPTDINLSLFGSVFLCSSYQHAVSKVTTDLREATVILGEKDGLRFPKAMSFDADKQFLYVCCGSLGAKYSRNFMKVFKRT